MTQQRPQLDPKAEGRKYLNRSLLGALNTVNAHQPFSRRGRTGVLTFFPSWLTTEMPLHAISWQAVATAAHIRRGALRSADGWVGLGVTAASWYGLFRLWQQDVDSKAIYTRALEEAFGEAVSAAPIPEEPSSKDRRRDILRGPANFPRRRWVNDPPVSYGEYGRRNLLDIWRSPNLRPGDRAPVLLQVHGGGWIIGNKDQQAMPLMDRLASNGWVCVSINYRLSPKAKWPAHIVDVKRALAWIKDN
ncbi:MAG: alpha/beta hydrolase, partial [Actinobacteria bacterium]|nr:alpha/beta hydrolase [Actinomycetota bacterium]